MKNIILVTLIMLSGCVIRPAYDVEYPGVEAAYVWDPVVGVYYFDRGGHRYDMPHGWHYHDGWHGHR